jgi:mannose/cellobiose epimerase-like protein (N-acyl-D-glucosamine 2-epimerase family)
MTMFDPADLATLRPWLLGHVLPFWLARIEDPHGFQETIDAKGEPVRTARRHVLVQARLTYVFSHAALMSRDPAFARAAEHGYVFLTRAFHGRRGGWYRFIDIDAAGPVTQVTGPTRDFYDQAFVLFALAWYGKASGEKKAFALADATWDFLEKNLGDPVHGGFVEEWLPGTDPRLPRRQNPHMHLLEALLALYAATRHETWLDRARALVDFFDAKLFDHKTDSLIEFLTEDLKPVPGAKGRWREPGHHFEWVWLLHDYHRHTGEARALDFADRLYASAARHGLERDASKPGGVFDGMNADGSIASDAKTLWPQTEYIKALVARAEFARDAQAWSLLQDHLRVLAQHYMRTDGANWHNQITRDGASMQAMTPARVLYHLFLAIAEVDRVQAIQR